MTFTKKFYVHKYEQLPTSFSPDEREHLVLEGWNQKNIFRRSVEERNAERVFSFYEGPPTVNGTPGIHHVFARTIKDAICRYKTMCGYRVERKAGWDTHGLPVEIAIEKELGFRHKREIEEYGVDKFNAKCKELVYSNIGRDLGWRELTERMGYWVNMDDPYITCTNDYIESVWWALKQFHDKGLIYKGFKIQPYCPRCETALSSHEVSLGYDTAKDPSVFIKFKRSPLPLAGGAGEGEPEFFLAWTTTPWTLLANIALAVHPDVDYVTVINTRKDKTERLVLAEALIGKLEGEVEIVDRKKVGNSKASGMNRYSIICEIPNRRSSIKSYWIMHGASWPIRMYRPKMEPESCIKRRHLARTIIALRSGKDCRLLSPFRAMAKSISIRPTKGSFLRTRMPTSWRN